MKPLVYIGLLLLVVGCEPSATSHKITFTKLNDQRSICFPETLTALPKHTDRDSMVGRVEFQHCEGLHEVTGWTDDHYSAIDGGSFWLELDSVGRVFGCSTTWPGFETFRSSSDSLNELISMAIAAASRPGHFGVRYPFPPPPTIETVRFIADSVPE